MKTLAFLFIGVAILGGFLLFSRSDYLPRKQSEFRKIAEPVAERAITSLVAKTVSSLSAQEQSLLTPIASLIAGYRTVTRAGNLAVYRYQLLADAQVSESILFGVPLDFDGTKKTIHLRVDHLVSGPQLAQVFIDESGR